MITSSQKIIKAMQIARATCTDMLFDEPRINHLRRVADMAILNGLDDNLICACWLSDIYVNMYDYEATLAQIENEVGEEVARIVDTVTQRSTETWENFVRRISLSPHGRAIMWLKALDILARRPNIIWIDAINAWFGRI